MDIQKRGEMRRWERKRRTHFFLKCEKGRYGKEGKKARTVECSPKIIIYMYSDLDE